ncbi:MAG: VCBS repeat-containing protein [Deltaproteobacteria bacterium]|nr:VCBS repeat-containing protein [Deltaproteobacteria bacterium]
MNFFLKKTNNVSKAFLLGLILIVASVGTPLSAFAKPVQVAVVPFKINAEKDLSYLRDGIVDMLSSRLSWADKVMVINNQETEKALKTVAGPLNEIKAREMGAKLDADYVLFGSLTVIGNSVSIDAKMVDVSGEKETLSFVIPAINLFASDINEKEFGRVMETRRVAPVSGPSSTRTGQAQADVRAHPDKLIAGGIAGSELQGGQKAAPDSAFIHTQSSESQSAQFWKSRNFKFLINGIAMGDVDNDGKIETVVVLDNNVLIYRTINNKLVKIKEIAKARNDHYIGVDIGDINNNGTPETIHLFLNMTVRNTKKSLTEHAGITG